MIIKKFIGKTEEEATAAARSELGDGVVIMNVKHAKKKGLAGLFGAKQVEVTVALESDNNAMPRVNRPEPVSRNTEKLENQVKETHTAVSVMSESSQNIEKKLDSLQNLLVNQLKQSETTSEESAAALPKEEPSKDKNTEEKNAVSEQDKFIRLLYNTMLESEVDEKYANEILADMEKEKKPNLPMDYILANVYQKMILKFGKANGISPSDNGPKIVVFMGPTGVGKTTTIAKIASKYAVEEHKKIALLTADTYRIAAAEQLRVYANILEVPFRVIYSPEEAREAIADYRDCDYIFVDTAGHSHKNEEQMKNSVDLYSVFKEAGDCQSFLVLSATTKYKDLLKIVAGYSEIGAYQLIFTKLDETLTLGNLLNVKLHTDVPIAFVTCGQNVPDDIEVFNPQKTVKLILSTKR